MTTMILLVLTFVFGVVHLLTLTKVFDKNLAYITEVLLPVNSKTLFGKFLNLLGVWFFYFSLCYQAWFWIFSKFFVTI